MRAGEDNERATVEAACQGDKAALATLYERYYTTIVWVAYSVLLDRALAEDAAQQAFAKACVKLRSLKQPGRFGPWLTTICRNGAQDMMRARRRDTLLHQAVAADTPAQTSSNGFNRAVRDAVDSLPAMYREVIVLHYYNQMSYREIESVLGLSRDVVKGRLARARRQMQAHLEREGFRREQ
ncbi:MAG: sigma-70 family RNA polymerase sigma factor [Phycisphaerales bacterium]|nr:MAG: sigma-70 family RNA polymerase sigma factor [Phycisphaerales bacterium]